MILYESLDMIEERIARRLQCECELLGQDDNR
jgi:hypothetical protein